MIVDLQQHADYLRHIPRRTGLADLPPLSHGHTCQRGGGCSRLAFATNGEQAAGGLTSHQLRLRYQWWWRQRSPLGTGLYYHPRGTGFHHP